MQGIHVLDDFLSCGIEDGKEVKNDSTLNTEHGRQVTRNLTPEQSEAEDSPWHGALTTSFTVLSKGGKDLMKSIE